MFRYTHGPDARLAGLLAILLVLIACDDPTTPVPIPLAEQELVAAPSSVALDGVGAALTFTLVDSTGTAVPADSVTWFSRAPGIATMDAGGRATAVAAGQAVVGARIDTAVVAYAVVNVAVPGGAITGWAADTVVRPNVRTIWGTADDDVWAGGVDEFVHHWDGSQWRGYRAGEDTELEQYEVADLSRVAGGPLLVVGPEGIQRLHEGTWQSMETDQAYRAVWSATATDAFAVDRNGWVWQYDGDAWTKTLGVVGAGMPSIWGSSMADVYVGDESGELIRFDGSGWSTVDYGATGDIRTIWGSGPDDVYVGGSFGVVRFDGSAWAPVQTALGLEVRSVAGSSALDVWAFREPDQFAHYDGTDWTREDPPPGSRFRDMWVSPSGTVYAVGDQGLLGVYSDGVWTLDHLAAGPRPVTGIWSDEAGDVYTAGAGGAREGTMGQWGRPCSADAQLNLPFDVWGISADELFVADTYMRVAHVHAGWCDVALVPQWGVHHQRAIWGAAPNDVWVVGTPNYQWSGPAMLFHFNGRSWIHTDGGIVGSPRMYDVWGAAGDRIWAVGELDGVGSIWRFDGAGWRGQSVPEGLALQGVWAASRQDVYAVGLGGRIFHYDGTEWTAMESPTAADLYAVSGSAPTDIYAVGDTTVLHFDGTTWSPVEGAPWAYYRAVRATADGPVYFGAEGQIIAAMR